MPVASAIGSQELPNPLTQHAGERGNRGKSLAHSSGCDSCQKREPDWYREHFALSWSYIGSSGKLSQ